MRLAMRLAGDAIEEGRRKKEEGRRKEASWSVSQEGRKALVHVGLL